MYILHHICIPAPWNVSTIASYIYTDIPTDIDICSKFRPVSNFMELHALTLAARSYALFFTCTPTHTHTDTHTHAQGHEYAIFQDDPDTLYYFNPHLLTSSPSHSPTEDEGGEGEEGGEDVSAHVEDCLSTIAQFVPDQLVQSLTKR